MNDIRPAAKKVERWWYRLAQVIYIMFVGLGLVIVAAFVNLYVPEISINDSTFQLVCNDGSRRAEVSGTRITGIINPSFYYGEEARKARYECAHTGLTNEQVSAEYEQAKQSDVVTHPMYGRLALTYVENQLIPEKQNYVLELIRKVYGGWGEFAVSIIVSVSTLLLVSLLVRAVFLYIVFKEAFWPNMFVFFRRRKRASTERSLGPRKQL